MSTAGSPRYRLVAAENIRNQIKRLARAALQGGRSIEFESDLEASLEKLVAQPLAWGDPLYQLKAMQLTMYHAMSDFLNLHYAVDEARRIVYLKEVSLMPRTGLGPEAAANPET